MLSLKYSYYMAVGDNLPIQTGISSRPTMDAAFLFSRGYQELLLVRVFMPLWVAENLASTLARLPQKITAKNLLKSVRACGDIYPKLRRARIERMNLKTIAESIKELPPSDLGNVLNGRCLLASEISGALQAADMKVPWDTDIWMEYLTSVGTVERQAAVGIDIFGVPHCNRCGATGNISEGFCYLCGEPNCLICHNCESMGLAKSCLPLYNISGDERDGSIATTVEPQLKFALTPPQVRAGEAVANFCRGSDTRFLVWAVCGGGKTEVSFAAVAEELSRGGRVLFAIPRKDIVAELLPRMQSAFPKISIQALYGGSGERAKPETQMFLATTHQTLRFFRKFDLIILDEADAFPYVGSEMLHFAVNRALKIQGKMIIMTATPTKEILREIASGKLPYVSIPARYHGKPLAVPQIKLLHAKGLFGDAEPMTPICELICQSLQSEKKVLIFLPTIKQIEQFAPILIHWGEKQGFRGDYTHSGRDNRLQVKEALNKRELDFAVVSTVFERGITIDGLDVIVLNADFEAVFDVGTLIQISGRVGRHGDDGQVWFVAKAENSSMREAVKSISAMNEEAAKLGFTKT